MNFTKAEQEMIRALKKERKAEIKETGEYPGYAIPKNHPDNGLDDSLQKFFKKQTVIAKNLVKKNVLVEIQNDRRLLVFDLKTEE